MKRVIYNTMAFAGLIAFSALLGAAPASAGLAAPTTHLGRSLHQSISAERDRFNICWNLRNPEYRPYYLTTGIQAQIETSFTDREGVPDRPRRNVLPSLPVGPPLSTNSNGYFMLEGQTRIETCRSFDYDDFSTESVYVQSTFRPWLRRDAELPEAVRRAAIEQQVIGRPLYSDEPLVSNVCVVEIRLKRARCQ